LDNQPQVFESGWRSSRSFKPDIALYGGNSWRILFPRYDHKTGENRASVWPVYDFLGCNGADISKYRFQWNFPIFTE